LTFFFLITLLLLITHLLPLRLALPCYFFISEGLMNEKPVKLAWMDSLSLLSM